MEAEAWKCRGSHIGFLSSPHPSRVPVEPYDTVIFPAPHLSAVFREPYTVRVEDQRSMRGTGPGYIGITWELVRKADSGPCS